MTIAQVFTSKLGTTRAGTRSRIWLEGARLKAAGFKAGTRYLAVWTDRTLTLTAGASASGTDENREVRKVSGKDENAKPIIDIVGQRVIDTFGARAERVRVSYGDGVITIRADI